MSATIHHLSPNVQFDRLRQNAFDTNKTALFLYRLWFEHLDHIEHIERFAGDHVTRAFQTVTQVMRESVQRDRKLYEGSDTEAKMERLKYLARVDAWRGAGELDTCQMLRFPSDRIVRRLKKKRGPLKQTDLPLPPRKRAAEPQPTTTQDREKAR